MNLRHKNFLRATSASAALLSLFVLPAAAQSPQQPASIPTIPQETPAFIDVVDETGRTVRLPQSIRRIVSLAPSLTETIYALGLQDELVGDTEFCDYPPDAQKKKKVGGAINPSLEEIAALHPDVVLLIKSLNRPETAAALERLGIPAYATDPHTVDQIISSTERLAAVLGAPDAGAALGAKLADHLSDLQKRVSALPPRRVVFVVWTNPLISVGKDTFIADAMRRAGAISIVESAQSWPQVNLEEIVKLQPEYLVFPETHSESVLREFESLSTLPGWRLLEAVQKKHYAVISDAVNRPAPRIVSAIDELAHQLHPEAFIEKEKPAEEIKVEPKPTPPRDLPNLSFNPQMFHPQFPTNRATIEPACAR